LHRLADKKKPSGSLSTTRKEEQGVKETEKFPAAKTVKTKRSHPPQVIQSKHEEGVVKLGVNAETSYEFEQGMIEALGVADEGLQNHLLSQTLGVFRPISESDISRETNITLTLMHEINPRNGMESLLAIQMLHTHHLAVKMMERAANTNQSIEDVDCNVNMATKLTRVFNQQLDTLQKLRGKGQQKMTVEHVHVYEGGQAVVGDINQGGGK
jgi:hypothetical protein